jgi:hypothetical protein
LFGKFSKKNCQSRPQEGKLFNISKATSVRTDSRSVSRFFGRLEEPTAGVDVRVQVSILGT